METYMYNSQKLFFLFPTGTVVCVYEYHILSGNSLVNNKTVGFADIIFQWQPQVCLNSQATFDGDLYLPLA